jgi:hypothetical protein
MIPKEPPSLLNDRRSELQVKHDDAVAERDTVGKVHRQLANSDTFGDCEKAVVPVKLDNTVRKSSQSGPSGW